jgi:hypothetical protein
MVASTVSQPRSGRRVVRRTGPTIDRACETALSELPAEIRTLVVRYADSMRESQEIRSALGTALTRHNLRWWDVDDIARQISFSSAA